jgi:hypothetical protein
VGHPGKVTGHNVNDNAGQHHKNNGQKTPVPVRAPPIGGTHIAYFLFQTMWAIVSRMMLRQVLTSSFGLKLQRKY